MDLEFTASDALARFVEFSEVNITCPVKPEKTDFHPVAYLDIEMKSEKPTTVRSDGPHSLADVSNDACV
jgi:hypothetical protein